MQGCTLCDRVSMEASGPGPCETPSPTAKDQPLDVTKEELEGSNKGK